MSQNAIPEKMRESFCVLPWIHAHVNTLGRRGLCCLAQSAPAAYEKMPWDEFFNSDYMKSVRKKMLNGVLPKECGLCETSNSPILARTSHNQHYQSEIDNILNLTDSEGHTSTKLRYLDYRSNTCNLSCKMCTPDASSSFQKIVNKQSDETILALFGHDKKQEPYPITRYFSEIYYKEMLQFIETENITNLYYAGGEPILEANHIQLIKNVCESGQASKITLFYNTNLSFSKTILEKWSAYLSYFKQVGLFVSIDGTEEVYNYIRHGTNFNTLKQNIDTVLDLNLPNTFLRFDITLSSLNLFYLENFADYCISKNVVAYSRLTLFSDQMPLLRPEAVPMTIRKKIAKRWKSYYLSRSPHEKELLKLMDECVDLFLNCKEWPDTLIPNYLKKLDLNEKMYGETEGKFFKLLEQDSIGAEWLAQLKNYTDKEII